MAEGELQHLSPGPVQFMLQSVGDVRESIGALKQAVDTLTVQSREQAKKLDMLSHRMYAAGRRTRRAHRGPGVDHEQPRRRRARPRDTGQHSWMISAGIHVSRALYPNRA